MKLKPNDSHLDRKKERRSFQVLLPAAKDLVTPEDQVLSDALSICLEDENDILIKRSVLDLLLQELRLDSLPVSNVLITSGDKKLLIMSCCRTTLRAGYVF